VDESFVRRTANSFPDLVHLYATAAAAIFNRLFFPSYNRLIGTLLAYATLALGFFVRPIGSVLFGRLGDLSAPVLKQDAPGFSLPSTHAT